MPDDEAVRDIDDSHAEVSGIEEPLKLNLGCGVQTPADWVNLDSSPGARLAPYPRLFRVLRALLPSWLLPAEDWIDADVRWMDLTKPWPLADGSVSAIYSSHFLEHLTVEEGHQVLFEAARVTRPGGRIRIVVPDLQAIVELYRRDREGAPEEAAVRFLQNTCFFIQPAPRGLGELLAYPVRRRHNHRVLHDEAFLRAELTAVGFNDLQRRSCGDSDILGAGAIDTPDRFLNAVCIEGVRG